MNTSPCCNANVQIKNSPPSFKTQVKVYVCSICQLTLKVLFDDAVKDSEEFLSDKHIPLGNHWVQVISPREAAVHFFLSQVVYRPNSDAWEVPYDLPDPGDQVKLLWCDRKAVGFYSVKPLGPRSEMSRNLVGAEMPTLDTAFILPAHRGRGFGMSMLQDFVESYPDSELGVSYPISKSMWKVLKKYLDINSGMKRKFWLVKEDCEEGNKTLIWLCLGRLNM